MSDTSSHPTDSAVLRIVTKAGVKRLDGVIGEHARRMRFSGAAGSVLVVPPLDGAPATALLGLGSEGEHGAAEAALLFGHLPAHLPDGAWRFEPEAGESAPAIDPTLALFAFRAGAYRFERYKTAARSDDEAPTLSVPGADEAMAAELAEAVRLVRDLINTPANDLGPAEIADAARALAERHGAAITVTDGQALREGFPLIHAVGQASERGPRLVDLVWGAEGAPKVTLVGKGVVFDTGGLDIKPASGMLLMKKDMGGAANVLGLAHLVMARRLPVRLRVLIPTVENAISGTAFRPGDVFPSRKGKTVEIGNTDAEGRLILADALALADEEAPDLIVDMATLTGAARVALGPDLPPFFTDDEAFAVELADAAVAAADPLWRLPLWKPYKANLASKIADTNNVTTDGFAGAVTAALFLQGFVEKAATWVHLDVYGWRPKAGALGPVGGEAQGIRALFALIAARYAKDASR
ncbi:leucyl aminopeptidase family protein [Antarcticirhabdus aurantiaca]|uniref:Leucyl aminopeptidase family protein n=1 Tax=Antarcticirhabdus aurantiaca TaxID=2606717 RepID=A0ACD4NTI5_9HYPH|nr:leucyl aminopeptidase family protein [Antarcticirhabdus aurantiaca]WAJ30135.1 leucyl aminopeptidase family protein [Jeongeuplla avenae]